MSCNDPRRTVVCVLGMHRSGTSAVSKILNLLGVHLGPSDALSPGAADNPKGYWEHRAFVEINDAILARFSGRWDDRPEWPSDWIIDPRLDDLRARAGALLSDHFSAAPLWGWKDPRTCLTLPFWQAVVGPMRYVICVRNPRAVAGSLQHRDGMSPARAGEVWLHHVSDCLAHTTGQPRLVVFYEDLIADWPRELRRMAAFIGDPERADDPAVRAAAGEFLEDTLCHHRSSMDALVDDPRIAFETKNLYVTLRAEASRARPAAPNVAETAAGQHVAVVLLKDQRDRLAADITALADEAMALRRERQTAVENLRSIQTSTAWRIACAIWRVVDVVFPRGTRRRVVYNAVVPHGRRQLPLHD